MPVERGHAERVMGCVLGCAVLFEEAHEPFATDRERVREWAPWFPVLHPVFLTYNNSSSNNTDRIPHVVSSGRSGFVGLLLLLLRRFKGAR
jgi:hypothetical protein